MDTSPVPQRGQDRTGSPQAVEALLEAVLHGRTPAERRSALNGLVDALVAPHPRADEEDPLVALFSAAPVVGADELRRRVAALAHERERRGAPLLTDAEHDAAQSLLLARLGAL